MNKKFLADAARQRRLEANRVRGSYTRALARASGGPPPATLELVFEGYANRGHNQARAETEIKEALEHLLESTGVTVETIQTESSNRLWGHHLDPFYNTLRVSITRTLGRAPEEKIREFWKLGISVGNRLLTARVLAAGKDPKFLVVTDHVVADELRKGQVPI